MPGWNLQEKRSVSKTANYSVRPGPDEGVVFDNAGASGAVTFTLPPIADVWDGWEIEVSVVADQTVTITAPSGKLIAFNNAAATSLAFSTAAEKIGGYVRIRYDGNSSKYKAFVGLGIETQTPVVS